MVAVGQVVTGGGAPHTHPWTDVTGEPDFATAASVAALDARVEVLEEAPAPDAPTWTEVTGKPVAFPPTTHTHTIAQVDGLQEELDNSATVAQLTATNSSVTALDTRVDTLEAAPAPPWLMVQIGGVGAYTAAPDARVYVGEDDPGSVPEGSVWIGPDA
jgi:hypothetical protein